MTYDKLKELEQMLVNEVIESDDRPVLKSQKIMAIKEVFTTHRTFMMEKERQEKVKKKVR